MLNYNEQSDGIGLIMYVFLLLWSDNLEWMVEHWFTQYIELLSSVMSYGYLTVSLSTLSYSYF
jgi:hypothetical protein